MAAHLALHASKRPLLDDRCPQGCWVPRDLKLPFAGNGLVFWSPICVTMYRDNFSYILLSIEGIWLLQMPKSISWDAAGTDPLPTPTLVADV